MLMLTFHRKTGLTVPDSGIRDEHGLEPMDDLFSSPNKAPKSSKVSRRSVAKAANATISSEEDMELGESTFFGPDSASRWQYTSDLLLEADKRSYYRHYSRACGSLNREKTIKYTNAPTKIKITYQNVLAVSRS
jgi:hypothetical protein